MKVFWTEKALGQVEAIQDFVAEDNPQIADRLGRALIERTTAFLGRSPHGGRPGRIPSTREFVVTETSYIVVFRVTENVEVLSVRHGSRRWPSALDDF